MLAVDSCMPDKSGEFLKAFLLNDYGAYLQKDTEFKQLLLEAAAISILIDIEEKSMHMPFDPSFDLSLASTDNDDNNDGQNRLLNPARAHAARGNKV